MTSKETKKQAEENELYEAVSETPAVSVQQTVVPEKTEEVKPTEMKKEETPAAIVPETPAMEVPKEETGEATFDKGADNKRVFVAIAVVVIIIVLALLIKSFGILPMNERYTNSVHGYSYKYPAELQLVAEGNIPPELAEQGIQNMSQLNLTNGDSLLVFNNEGGDNVVYTVLELSSRQNFGDFDSYITALFASLDQSKEVNGINYNRKDSTVGKGISSIEYSFEMEVPIDNDGNTRTGVFYDNVFKTDDGRAYSISFGYPKDVPDPDEYVEIYRNILTSFKPGDVDTDTPSVSVEDENVFQDSEEAVGEPATGEMTEGAGTVPAEGEEIPGAAE